MSTTWRCYAGCGRQNFASSAPAGEWPTVGLQIPQCFASAAAPASALRRWARVCCKCRLQAHNAGHACQVFDALKSVAWRLGASHPCHWPLGSPTRLPRSSAGGGSSRTALASIRVWPGLGGLELFRLQLRALLGMDVSVPLAPEDVTFVVQAPGQGACSLGSWGA